MSGYVADLDRGLAKAGEDIVLRRVTGTGTTAVVVDATVRASVRPLSADELVGTLAQGSAKAIISPTDIEAAQWPGGQPVSPAIHQADPRLPKIGDKAIIQGRIRDIRDVNPILVDGDLVRIELMVAG